MRETIVRRNQAASRAARHDPREEAERPVGVSEEVAADGPALRLVGVEEPWFGAIERDQSELPSQVPGVLHAGVHSLGADGAVDVGGVAGEEHGPLPVGPRLPVMQPEMRQPDGISQADGAAGGSIDRLLELVERELAPRQRLFRLARRLALFRLAPPLSEGDHPPFRRCPEGEEHRDVPLRGEGVEHVGFDGAVGVDVAEHEVLQVRLALERDARLLSHRAVGAVATDQKPRAERLFGTIGPA